MKVIWEKRPGRWKVSGDPKVYPTEQAAKDAAGIVEPEVEVEIEPEEFETFEDALEAHGEDEPYVNPLELLRKASYGVKS